MLDTENIRLKKFRNFLKLNQKEFCEPLNLQQGSYSDIERGRSHITFSLLKKMMKRYGLNPLWLLTGKGQMFLPQDYLEAAIDGSLVMEELPNYGQEDEKTREIHDLTKENNSLKDQIKALQGQNEAYKKLIDIFEARQQAL